MSDADTHPAIVQSDRSILLETDGDGALVSFQEKPRHEYGASMGLYVFEPDVLEFIPDRGEFGFDDLAYMFIASEVPVYVYSHKGYWLDIGVKSDLEQAQEESEMIRRQVIGD